jgi:hypothetical protein
MNAIVYPAGGPTPAAFALDSNGNPVGLVRPDGNIFLQTDGAGATANTITL